MGPNSHPGRFGKEKNPLPLQGIELRIVQPKAQTYTYYGRIQETCFNMRKMMAAILLEQLRDSSNVQSIVTTEDWC